MSEAVYNLAFDFGASSGRMMLCKYQDGKMELEELHRFPNDEVRIGGHIYWDLFRLYHEMKQGLKRRWPGKYRFRVWLWIPGVWITAYLIRMETTSGIPYIIGIHAQMA